MLFRFPNMLLSDCTRSLPFRHLPCNTQKVQCTARISMLRCGKVSTEPKRGVSKCPVNKRNSCPFSKYVLQLTSIIRSEHHLFPAQRTQHPRVQELFKSKIIRDADQSDFALLHNFI